MTRTSPPQRAMSSGEISPLLHRRTDYQRAQTGLAACRGFLPLVQGGVTRAPGTVFQGRTLGDQGARLLPFEFAVNDAVVIELTPFQLRVWRYGALVTRASVPYVAPSPYDAAALQRLQWVQSADVIWLVDGVLPPYTLSRFALDDWRFEPVAFKGGPFGTENDNRFLGLRVQPPRPDGSLLTSHSQIETEGAAGDYAVDALQGANGARLLVTASAPIFGFGAGVVGGRFEIAAADNQIPLWVGDEGVPSSRLLVRNDGNTYLLVAGSNTGVNPPLHTEGTERTSYGRNAVFRWVSGERGIARIVEVLSPTQAWVLAETAISPALISSASWRWAQPAWGFGRGQPSSIEIFDQRLVLGGTPAEPRNLWFSAVGDFRDMTSGVEADDAFGVTIAGSSSLNRIAWLRTGQRGLHIGALGEEYSSRALQRQQAVGPSNVTIGLDSSIGSVPQRPLAPDGNPIFVSRDRGRVMQIAFVFERDGNVSSELSRPSDHIGADSFQELVWQGAPRRLMWARLGTGELAVMLHEPAEDVLGWARHSLAGGAVESMAVTRDATGANDIVTLVVRRQIGGATVRCIEQLLPDLHLFAASGFQVAEPQTDFAVPHLAGAEVHAWTDMGAFGPLPVAAGGAVSLPKPVSVAQIGLFDDTHMLQTLDIVAQAPSGDTLGRKKRLHAHLGIAVHDTAQANVQVVERELGQPDRVGKAQPVIANRPVADRQTARVSGVARLPLPSGHATEVALRFRPHGGAPFTLLAVTPMVQESGD